MVESRRVVEHLISCRQRGIKVRVLTDLVDERVQRQPRFRTTGVKPIPKGPDDQSHAYCRRLLGEGLVHCRGCLHLVHAKLWIVDDTVAFIGSANLTDNSLGFQLGAMETMVRIDDPKTVAALRDSFDVLWRYTPFRQHLHGEHLRIERKHKAATSISLETLRTEIRPGLVLNWNVPGRGGALLEGVVDQIQRARSDIVLCARSVVDLHSLPQLLETLHAALKRGIEITAVVAKNPDWSESQYPDPPTIGLLAAGMSVRGWPGLHAKGVLVDGDAVIVLSANFSPALNTDNPTANIECGITCSASGTPFREFGDYLLALREHAPYQLAVAT